MPRKSVLSDKEKLELLRFPTELLELNKYYLLTETEISIIGQKRGSHNRLGFAILLCGMRYPGISINHETNIPQVVVEFIANQLKIKDTTTWDKYFTRDATRWEHISELKNLLGFESFTIELYDKYVEQLLPIAKQTNNGFIVAETLIGLLRQNLVLIPETTVIERLSAEVITLGSQGFYADLITNVNEDQKQKLDNLLKIRPGAKISYLHWLLQPATIPKPKHILMHIERLKFINELGFNNAIGKNVHVNRLIKLAREGKNMPAGELQKFEPLRRLATSVAIILEVKASIIDEIIELNDKILGNIFNKAKNSHNEEFQSSSKSINEKLNTYAKIGQALIKAKQENLNPFTVIEEIMTWDEFTQTVQATQELAKPNNFDSLYLITKYYSWIKRYVTEFINVLDFRASSNTTNIINALNNIKIMHEQGLRKVPDDAPVDFIRKRWETLVFKEDGGIDRQFYEFAVLSELKNALRSGDIWVTGSRQYKDFEEYLLDPTTFTTLKSNSVLPTVMNLSFQGFMQSRINQLTLILDEVHKLAINNEIPDVIINDDGLKVTQLTNSVPDEVYSFSQKVYSMLPKIKITHLLQEVDSWVNYTNVFTHLKSDKSTEKRELLQTVILSDGINLGLSKMAESCHGTTYSKLSSIQAWYVREETYKQATAIVVNAQHQQAVTTYWGAGNSSSSDGQRFNSGGSNVKSSSVNPKYGNTPGMTYYSHTSDLYAPFHVTVITSNLRDSTYVLDGLLHHEADLNIYEHYTDTAGFTDHVFALMHLLGFKFAPRIRDLNDKRIYLPSKTKTYPGLSSIIGGYINLEVIEKNWDDILRLSLSIQQGTVTASLMLKKLGSYPRQNNLAVALRELGKIERSLFMLEWFKDPQLRRRVQAGLNKGEAKHALTRAVHFNRLGEIRDRTFENQLHRASGLNLVVGAIILWNTVHIEKVVDYLRKTDK